MTNITVTVEVLSDQWAHYDDSMPVRISSNSGLPILALAEILATSAEALGYEVSLPGDDDPRPPKATIVV